MLLNYECICVCTLRIAEVIDVHSPQSLGVYLCVQCKILLNFVPIKKFDSLKLEEGPVRVSDAFTYDSLLPPTLQSCWR